MSAPPSPSPAGNQDEAPQQSEHLNIKVTDNNNEVFFKIKRTTQLKKLMDAFCERQGKSFTSVRFLFDGTRVNPTDNPEMVSQAERCSRDSGKHMRSQSANTDTARDAGRRHPRGPPGADRRRLLSTPKPPSLLDTSALHDRHENDHARTKTTSKRF
jgi:small ubiquitin-related modifier